MIEEIILGISDALFSAWIALETGWLDLTAPIAEAGVSRWWLTPLAIVPLAVVFVAYTVARLAFLSARRKGLLNRQRDLYADVVGLRQQVRNYERLVQELK